MFREHTGEFLLVYTQPPVVIVISQKMEGLQRGVVASDDDLPTLVLQLRYEVGMSGRYCQNR